MVPLEVDEIEDLEKTPHVVLKDTSKYGTLVNKERIVGAEKVLKDGDEVCFGAQGAIFTLERRNFVLCLDSKSETLENLHAISKIGAHAVGRWGPECTCVLVSEDAAASSTVACALAAGTPVIGPSWLKAALSIEGPHGHLPEFEKHPPNIKFHLEGGGLASLPPEKSTESREHLFDGMVFVWDPTELSVEQDGGVALAVSMLGGQNLSCESDALASLSPKGKRLILIEGESDAVKLESLRHPCMIGSIRILVASILLNRNDQFRMPKKRRSSSVHSDSETVLEDESDPQPPARTDTTPSTSMAKKDCSNTPCNFNALKLPKQNVVHENLVSTTSEGERDPPVVNYKKFRKVAHRSDEREIVPFMEEPWSERMPGSLKYQERMLVEAKLSRQAEEMFTTDARKSIKRGGQTRKSRT
mmetsp:Transcript_6933/g.42338  ORF Transcript_6933/g.42338 Transcript_6933/m.42338 type:complete len:416 (+) Transcript_6933:277-1524(+)